MDIKAKIEKAVKELLADENLMKKFEQNPVEIVEKLVGADLPDEMVNQAVDAIKAKIKLEKAGDMLIPSYSKGNPQIPQSTYDAIAQRWNQRVEATGGKKV